MLLSQGWKSREDTKEKGLSNEMIHSCKSSQDPKGYAMGEAIISEDTHHVRARDGECSESVGRGVWAKRAVGD